ncbi:MAG: OmpA family protein [Chromatiales bacterium]|jgi:chemotaxis protein MotB|nr:OmpA family protein [Chromatiales bacterium]
MRLDEGLEDQKLSLDITPLIDIIFLLVLFFAVSTSFISGEDLQSLQTDVVAFKDTSEKLEVEVAKRGVAIDTLQTDFTRMVEKKTREIQHLAANLEKSDGEAAKLEFMVAALENQRVGLEGRLQSRAKKNQSLETQLQQAYQDFNSLNAELTTLKSDAEQKAEQERLLRGLLLERQQESDDLRGEQDELRDQRAALVDQLAMVRGFLDQQSSEAKSKQARLTKEKMDVATQLADTTAAVEKLTQTLAANQARLSEASGTVDAAAAKEILLQKLIADKAAEFDGMRVRLESAVAARNTLDQALTENKQSAQAEAGQLQAEARAAQTQILRLQAELNKYREVASLDREEIEQILKAQEQLQEGMSAYLEDKSLGIKRDQQRLTLQLSDKILFASGSPNIKSEGLKVLKNLGTILKKRIAQLQVQVGGHTDNIPVGRRRGALRDNWGLSAARAVNVVRYFEKEVGINAKRMAAVGYGEHRPVGDNSLTSGRALNRRIEIVLIPR